MPQPLENLMEVYVSEVKKIFGEHLKKIILYGSYARGDFNADSDIDIMILLDISDMEIKDYRDQLSFMTYDFNMDNDLRIMPILAGTDKFRYWLPVYPFYQNIDREGISLYAAG